VHNATTKQRLSALRRRFGLWTTLPRWARIRRERPAAETGLQPVDTGRILTARVDPSPPDPALADTVALADPAAALPPAVPVLQPTPPLADLAPGAAEAAEPPASIRRRRRGIAAGVFAGLVLVLLAFLALVPWLRGRAPAGPEPAAAAPSTVAAPVAAPSPRPSPPLRGGEGDMGAPAPTAGVVEVRAGDTLWDLAAAHLGDPYKWPLLHEANRGNVDNPDLIYPGQSLRIPAG
jgi:hypothetical protein